MDLNEEYEKFKKLNKVEESNLPPKDEELEEVVEECIKEFVDEDINKDFEEFKKMENKTNEISNDSIMRELIMIRGELVKINSNVTHRKEEDINVMKMVFDRLKKINAKIGRWFIISAIILVLAGGVTFATITYNWENIEPKIDKILGITKIASNASRIGG